MQVCVRCIFRLFGVHEPVYSCSLLTSSMLLSFLKEEKGFQCDSLDSEVDSENNGYLCSICLGILQLAYSRGGELLDSPEKMSVEDFAGRVAEVIKKEDHQTDGFSIEISVPPVIVANERAFW